MRTRRKIKRCWLKQQQKNPGGGALQMEETASAKALSQGFSHLPPKESDTEDAGQGRRVGMRTLEWKDLSGWRNGKAILEGNLSCRLVPPPQGRIGRISHGDCSALSPAHVDSTSPCWGAPGTSLSLTPGSSPCSNLVVNFGLKT